VTVGIVFDKKGLLVRINSRQIRQVTLSAQWLAI
jgi:hypothetical protein